MNFLPSLAPGNKCPKAESELTRVLFERSNLDREGATSVRRRMQKTGRIAYTMPRAVGEHGNLSVVIARPGSVSAARQWIQWRGREEILIGFSTGGVREPESAFLARGGGGQPGGFPQSESDYVYRAGPKRADGRRAEFL